MGYIFEIALASESLKDSFCSFLNTFQLDCENNAHVLLSQDAFHLSTN